MAGAFAFRACVADVPAGDPEDVACRAPGPDVAAQNWNPFEDVFGFSRGRNIIGGGRAAVDRSFDRYLRAVEA